MIQMGFDKGNRLVPVIVQDVYSRAVLMSAYMNEESLRMTMDTGCVTYYSHSRQESWIKGETSEHYRYVKDIRIDCDEDTILLPVEQVGATYHAGHTSCFYRNMEGEELWRDWMHYMKLQRATGETGRKEIIPPIYLKRV